MKYTELIPNVKWNCPSHNNRNVLVICHPQQIPFYLSKVEEFVWERFTNITIWQTNSEIIDKNQLMNEVDQIDAVICFVTELLVLTPNVIGDELIPIIIEKKYPFLPILDGRNLEQIFEQKYGHIHFAKYKENQALRFDAIEKFMEGLPLHKKRKNQWFELSDRNMDSFSQTYFISYRKVDGRYIDYLQHRIHKEASLVDTKLWYDAYLVPGEDYDNHLLRMIEKCSAVILVITPHLLEPDNYVIRVEVPFAEKCGKPVIGIMMEETDLKVIRDLYGVEKIYRIQEWDSFTDILLDAGISVPKIDSYPRHLYRLATAYIDGNDVEYNMPVACGLLYQAIQYKYYDAYKKLIEIKTGEYEKTAMNRSFQADHLKEGKDIVEAKRLFDEYINILQERYEIKPTESCFIPLLDCLRKYGEFYLNENMFKQALKPLLLLYKYVAPLEKQEISKLYTYLSVASLLLAKTYTELEDYDIAEKYYKKAVDTDRMLNDESATYNSITYTNLLTSLCEFGDFCQKRGKLLRAKILYQEVLETIQNNGVFYGREWDDATVYHGYEDETTVKGTEEAGRFAIIGLWEIETEILKAGKFRPTIKKYSRKLITSPQILKSCEKDDVELLSHEIMINSFDKIHWLIDFISESELEFDLCQNRFCVDAKCLTAVMSLDINDVCQLVVHTADMDRATKILSEIVKKMNE